MTETVRPGAPQTYRSETRFAAPPEDLFDAFTTLEGIAGWWTEQVSGSGAEGLTPVLHCYDTCSRGWDHGLATLHTYIDSGTRHAAF
jgi:hypothetical protein